MSGPPFSLGDMIEIPVGYPGSGADWPAEVVNRCPSTGIYRIRFAGGTSASWSTRQLGNANVVGKASTAAVQAPTPAFKVGDLVRPRDMAVMQGRTANLGMWPARVTHVTRAGFEVEYADWNQGYWGRATASRILKLAAPFTRPAPDRTPLWKSIAEPPCECNLFHGEHTCGRANSDGWRALRAVFE